MLRNLFLVSVLASNTVYAADLMTDPAPADAATSMQPAIAPVTPIAPEQPVVTSMPGGYNSAKTDDKDVMDAANFAVAQMQKGTLTKILAAEVQVVAGKNYLLHLEIKDPSGVNYLYDVVVFVPLPVSQQPMQLTSVQALGMAP